MNGSAQYHIKFVSVVATFLGKATELQKRGIEKMIEGYLMNTLIMIGTKAPRMAPQALGAPKRK